MYASPVEAVYTACILTESFYLMLMVQTARRVTSAKDSLYIHQHIIKQQRNAFCVNERNVCVNSCLRRQVLVLSEYQKYMVSDFGSLTGHGQAKLYVQMSACVNNIVYFSWLHVSRAFCSL